MTIFLNAFVNNLLIKREVMNNSRWGYSQATDCFLTSLVTVDHAETHQRYHQSLLRSSIENESVHEFHGSCNKYVTGEWRCKVLKSNLAHFVPNCNQDMVRMCVEHSKHFVQYCRSFEKCIQNYHKTSEKCSRTVVRLSRMCRSIGQILS